MENSKTLISDVGSFTDKHSGILKKASQIVFARGQGELDLVDRKIFNFLLYRAYQDEKNSSGVHRALVSEMLDFLGHSSTNRLNESLARLSHLEMTIDYVDEAGVPNSASTHYLSYNMEKSQNGWIQYALDPILLGFLHSPAIFARLSMSHLRQFRSAYSASLYEIMSLYINRHHKTWETSLDEFRSRMRLSEAYNRFDNMKKRVIEPAVDEINAIAPFNIDVEYVKGGLGGKVQSLKFTAIPKNIKTLLEISGPVRGGKQDFKRDPNTPDLFDNITDSQRISREVSQKAIETGISLISLDEDISNYMEEWQNTIKGRRVKDPDKSFLNWLDIQLAKKNQKMLENIDEDTIASILSQWDDKS